MDPRWETWPSKANLNGILLWEEFYNNPLFLDNLNLIISQSQYDASQLTEEPKITPDTQRKALFNPWMAGQMVSMFCLGTSFAVGIGAIDSNSQCRLVLHLYNALRVKGLISELPLLETLIDLFSKTKSLWVGGRPTARGGFAKAFLLAFGYNIKWAGELAQTFAQEDFPKKYYSRNPEAVK